MSQAVIAFASMLKLATPGITPGSRVELTAQAAQIDREDGLAVAEHFKWSRAVWPSWSRQETEAEGMERWATIAVSVERVAVTPPPEWVWRGAAGELQLTRALVTIARHESAFWRSVQEGRLRGTRGEVCLIQAMPATARAFGYDPESLVGIDAEATERCFRVGAAILGNMRRKAERTAHCRDALWRHWFEPTIALYGSGADCIPTGDWVKGVADRVHSYELTAQRAPLPQFAIELIEAAES